MAAIYFLPRNLMRPFTVRCPVPKKLRKVGEFTLLSTKNGFSRPVTLSPPIRAPQRYPRNTNLRSIAGSMVTKSGKRNWPGPETIVPNWSTVTNGKPLRQIIDHAKSNFLSFQKSGYEPHATNWLGASHGSAPAACVPSRKASIEKSTVRFEVVFDRVYVTSSG